MKFISTVVIAVMATMTEMARSSEIPVATEKMFPVDYHDHRSEMPDHDWHPHGHRGDHDGPHHDHDGPHHDHDDSRDHHPPHDGPDGPHDGPHGPPGPHDGPHVPHGRHRWHHHHDDDHDWDHHHDGDHDWDHHHDDDHDWDHHDGDHRDWHYHGGDHHGWHRHDGDHHGPHGPPLRPFPHREGYVDGTDVRTETVQDMCNQDVEELCKVDGGDEDDPLVRFLLLGPPPESATESANGLDAILGPRHQEPQDDIAIDSLMNEMMSVAFRFSFTPPPFLFAREEVTEEKVQPEDVFGTMVSSLLDHAASAAAATTVSAPVEEPMEGEEKDLVGGWTPFFLREKFAERSDAILAEPFARPSLFRRRRLTESSPEVRQRMARRLQEIVSGDHMPPPPPRKPARLGFGCGLDSCLWKNHFDEKVSGQCSDLLSSILEQQETSRSQTASLHATRMVVVGDDDEMPCFVAERIIYSILITAIMLLIVRAVILRRIRRAMGLHSDRRRIKMKVARAMLSNRRVRTALEEAIGEEITALLPFLRRLVRMDRASTGGGWITKCDKLVAFLPIFALLAFVVHMEMAAPFLLYMYMLPALIIAIVYRLCRRVCCKCKDASTDSCCCCSGGVEGGSCCDDCCCCSSGSEVDKKKGSCCDDCCCCDSPGAGKGGCCDDCCCDSPGAGKGGCCDDGCCKPDSPGADKGGCCDDGCCKPDSPDMDKKKGGCCDGCPCDSVPMGEVVEETDEATKLVKGKDVVVAVKVV